MNCVKGIIAVAAIMFFASACAPDTSMAEPGEADFPRSNISGVVMWGAGGGTDSLMRPLSALAESELGVSIVIQNMTGAAGSVATQFVYDSPATGYTLLMGAENPALYQALGISLLTYDDFATVFLIGDETVGIAVRAGSPFYSFTGLVGAALNSPGEIRLSTTGVGGLPWTVSAFITDVTGATFNQIPYDSDASAMTAVLNGEVDFTVVKVQTGLASYEAGLLNFLTMLSTEPVPNMPDVPLVTAEFPGFNQYLPWGPFYGVFVRNDTPADIVAILSSAFSAAAQDPAYREVLENFNINFLGLSGAEADAFISAWQENTINALRASGAID